MSSINLGTLDISCKQVFIFILHSISVSISFESLTIHVRLYTAEAHRWLRHDKQIMTAIEMRWLPP